MTRSQHNFDWLLSVYTALVESIKNKALKYRRQYLSGKITRSEYTELITFLIEDNLLVGRDEYIENWREEQFPKPMRQEK